MSSYDSESFKNHKLFGNKLFICILSYISMVKSATYQRTWKRNVRMANVTLKLSTRNAMKSSFAVMPRMTRYFSLMLEGDKQDRPVYMPSFT